MDLATGIPCQVAADVTLPCPGRESGGRQCERLDEHDDDHALTRHTIEHSLAGSGYPCSTVDLRIAEAGGRVMDADMDIDYRFTQEERRVAVRDPHPSHATPKVHIRNAKGLLACGVSAPFLTETLTYRDLGALKVDQLCSHCWPINQAVILR